MARSVPLSLVRSSLFVRHRVWSELTPYSVLASDRVLAQLQDFSLELLLAVRPEHLPELSFVLRACSEANVRVALWPMLDDAHGRWLSSANAEHFISYTEALLRSHATQLHGLALDLEPPIGMMNAAGFGSGTNTSLLRGVRALWKQAHYEHTKRSLKTLFELAKSKELEVSSALIPVTLLDEPGGTQHWQRMLGCPHEHISWDHASVMLYTSMLEGWSRGTLDREHAVAMLARGAILAKERFGDRAGVSLGAVGTGALGNEPTYRDESELARDVAVARACAVHTLSLFELQGVLSRPPTDRWWKAFTGKNSDEVVLPRVSRGVAGALQFAKLAAKGVGYFFFSGGSNGSRRPLVLKRQA